MIQPRLAFFILLFAYTITMLLIEWWTSQAFVRLFFTDIQGPVPFYAINTTLSVFALWSTGLIFAVCLLCIDSTKQAKEKWFYLSQTIMFIYLGFDDRFMVHEAIGQFFRESLFMGGLYLIELFCLFQWGQLSKLSRPALFYLSMGGIWAGMMLIIDTFLPAHTLFRLPGEDLAKLWSGVCLFLFAWEILLSHIQQLRGNSEKPF